MHFFGYVSEDSKKTKKCRYNFFDFFYQNRRIFFAPKLKKSAFGGLLGHPPDPGPFRIVSPWATGYRVSLVCVSKSGSAVLTSSRINLTRTIFPSVLVVQFPGKLSIQAGNVAKY